MPSHSAAAVSVDIRVQDYLNDKFQTLADLDSLDSLLSSVQTQQTQLRTQLATADARASDSRRRLSAHDAQLRAEIDAFQRKQTAIDRRLLATTTADTAIDAAERFEDTIEKLRRLDVANKYVDLLGQVQRLDELASRCVGEGDPEAALRPYTQLQQLARALHARNEAAEGAAVHLVDYVEVVTKQLWQRMREKLAGGLEEVLAKIEWPAEKVILTEAVAGEFRTAFEKLLVLQGPDLEGAKGTATPLLPLEVLAKPLALRFRYHFDGDRPTNRIDRPEWFLAHITGLVTTYSDFLRETVQPILSESENPLVNKRDAVNEFITALLPIVMRKTKNLLPQILDQAQLLSHFIHAMIKFDAELREEFYYTPFGSDGPWKGMTHEVLVVENGFAGWLRVEKEFALSRYHTILSAPDAWVLDYDSVEPTDSKPTKSAIRLKDLVETVTDGYRPLISFSQRLRFLIDIQIAILDQYHERLNGSVEAFRVLSSSIARAVQGTSKEEVEALSGLAGLERLCKAYGSAVFMENCMRDWGEDIFFLELWEELQSRASKVSPNKSLAGNMKIRDVASVTSSALVSGDDDDDGALFDETAGSYRELRRKTEETMVDHLVSLLKNELKAYTKINNWASVDPTLTASSISPELVSVLTTLSTHFSFLARALAPAVHRRVVRAVATALQTHLWDYVLARNSFSLAGARQFHGDMAELWNACGGREMLRLQEACTLLTLPTVRPEGDADDAQTLLLADIVNPVFENNARAREAMEKLSIELLQTSEVRAVLQKRVEAFGSG